MGQVAKKVFEITGHQEVFREFEVEIKVLKNPANEDLEDIVNEISWDDRAVRSIATDKTSFIFKGLYGAEAEIKVKEGGMDYWDSEEYPYGLTVHLYDQEEPKKGQ